MEGFLDRSKLALDNNGNLTKELLQQMIDTLANYNPSFHKSIDLVSPKEFNRIKRVAERLGRTMDQISYGYILCNQEAFKIYCEEGE